MTAPHLSGDVPRMVAVRCKPPCTHPGGRLMLPTLGPGGCLEVSVTSGKNGVLRVDFLIQLFQIY